MTGDWRQRATLWLRDVFPTSERFELHVNRERAWGVSWRVVVDEGDFWFKRPADDFTSEVPLLRLLAGLQPGLVLAAHADHPDERWILTRDQGPTLAVRSREEGGEHYVDVARALARVQRSVECHLTELRSLGLPEFDPADFRAHIDDHLRWVARLPGGHPLRLTGPDAADVADRAARLAARWEALPDHGPAVGLDHNDLHLGNAFPGPLLSDWADSVIGHPFAALRALLVPGRKVFGPELGDAVRQAYLGEWGDPAELSPVLEVAMQLGAAQRFLAWRRIHDLGALAEYHEYVTPLLTRLGDPIDDIDVP